jgi:hypothetical protein
MGVQMQDGNRERYDPITLPFESNAFDMVLSSNFLFYYSDRLNYSFHLNDFGVFTRVKRSKNISNPRIQHQAPGIF